ncbi:DUF4129 domain-containing protein [candidate division KSB1 bacterium]|nr:DUF4129 domain-containing protein [candidate division KSB1 bacterium]NIR70315.1 DUF4129 domain-containing protein [candidate division KSB1 bacterium]NIS27619.1 DUF4129 domain-containing protein [candidate division KSB1 bacterium]NIT74459.1 DUF4129 domain-containing protein [candidate division KSB1 bacterium]NIU28984.1 DUF4129 domain-containing protein [candidate division KSB1 bacterium]
MKNRVVHSLAVLVMFALLFPVSLTAEKKGPVHVHSDSSQVTVRTPPAENIAAFRADEAFAYDREFRASNTLWHRIKFWIWDKFLKYFPFKGLALFWRVLPYLLLAGATIFVVSRLLKTDVKSIFYESSDEINLEFRESEEDIQAMNFHELIDEAAAQKKYRRAIRLFYLSILEDLTEKGLINWKLAKTNQDYMRELQNSKLQRPFAEITRLFEYIWYGNVHLNETGFQDALQTFRHFRDELARA